MFLTFTVLCNGNMEDLTWATLWFPRGKLESWSVRGLSGKWKGFYFTLDFFIFCVHFRQLIPRLKHKNYFLVSNKLSRVRVIEFTWTKAYAWNTMQYKLCNLVLIIWPLSKFGVSNIMVSHFVWSMKSSCFHFLPDTTPEFLQKLNPSVSVSAWLIAFIVDPKAPFFYGCWGEDLL